MQNPNKQYSLFIDESGIADLTDYTYKKFTLTGVIVPNVELNEVSGYFTFVKRKYGLKEDIPFHTYDLLENPESSSKLSPADARQFVDSMCEFIELTPLVITTAYTNKEVFRKEFQITTEKLKGSKEAKERRGLIYYLSALKQLECFTKFLEKKDGLGFIHSDSRMYQDVDLLKSFWSIKQSHKKGAVKNPYYESARKRVVSITFAEKPALSSGVQIADFISFVVFAHTRRKMSSFSDIQLGGVWEVIKEKLNYEDLIETMGKEEVRKYL